MKKTLKIGVFILSLVLLLSSCRFTDPEEKMTDTQTQNEETVEPTVDQKWGVIGLNIAENSPSVFLPVGRTYSHNQSLTCDFTCTGVRFAAECEGDVLIFVTTSAKAYFTVFINGNRSETRISVPEGSGWVTVAKDLPHDTYEFEFVKQSQYTMASAELKEVRLTGRFLSVPKERELFIEFYGDSILNGSNIYLGGTSVETSDGTRAFGWLTAQTLNADCNIIGCGGLGLSVSGMNWVMNDVWNLSGSNLNTAVPEYDFERIPDVVVVELGVNDAARASQTTVQAYRIQVKKFVEDLRARYGKDVPIVWVYGYHPTSYWEHTKYVLDLLGGEAANLYCCELSQSYIAKENGGDGYHPSVETSQIMANELSAYLQNLLQE